MTETSETLLYCTAIFFAWRAIAANGGKAPAFRPTELDRLPFLAKLAIVAATGVACVMLVLLLDRATDSLCSWLAS